MLKQIHQPSTVEQIKSVRLSIPDVSIKQQNCREVVLFIYLFIYSFVCLFICGFIVLPVCVSQVFVGVCTFIAAETQTSRCYIAALAFSVSLACAGACTQLSGGRLTLDLSKQKGSSDTIRCPHDPGGKAYPAAEFGRGQVTHGTTHAQTRWLSLCCSIN